MTEVVEFVNGGRRHLPFAQTTWLSRRMTALCRNPRRLRDHYWGELWECPACKPQAAARPDGEDAGAGDGLAYGIVIRGERDGGE